MSFEPSYRPEPQGTPPVWKWYVFMCVLGALSNFALAGFGFWLMAEAEELAAQAMQPKDFLVIYGMTLILVGIFFGIANLVLPFLPKKPWMYVLHMVNIVAAGLSFCCLPLAIPIFIYWLKPDVKEMFDFR